MAREEPALTPGKAGNVRNPASVTFHKSAEEMKNMKRIIPWMLALTLVLSLAACGTSKDETPESAPETESVTAPAESSTVPSESETEPAESSAVPSEPETEPAESSEEETEIPETEENTSEEVPESSEETETEEPESLSEFAEYEGMEPLHTAENAAFRMSLLAARLRTTESELTKEEVAEQYGDAVAEAFDGTEEIGELVYSVTNLTTQPLYTELSEIGPGETVYETQAFYSSLKPEKTSGSPGYFLMLFTSSDIVGHSMFDDNCAGYMEYFFSWEYDAASGEITLTDPLTGYNGVNEDALTSDELGSYTYDIELIHNEYYTLKLIKMRGGKYNGESRVVAEFELINSSGSRYLLGEAWKAEAGWEPGRDWFNDDAKKTITEAFFSKDSENVTGSVSFDIWGWSWDGATGTQLFKDTVTVTLRLDEKDPVVSVD